jgi:hypothetical protein
MADATEPKKAKETKKAKEQMIVPNAALTFTIVSEPRRPAARKTIERLMWMQQQVKKDHSMLQRRRKQKDIKYTVRAGRVWFDRPRATRTVRCEKGASFTLNVTPQIVNDLKSVEKYLKISKAS